MELNEKNNIIEQLNKRCLDLEEQLRLADTINRTSRPNQTNNNTSSDFHLSNLTNTLGNGTNNTNNETLSDELNRALGQLKSKRMEVQKYQIENEQLKSQLVATTAAAIVVSNQPSPEMTNHDLIQFQDEIKRLSMLIDELNKEKNDLNSDLNEKNAKLDALLEREEKYNNDLNQLHHDLANKDQHIADLNNIIDDISAKLNHNANVEMIVLKYENELAQNRMSIGNYETELGELRMTLKKYEIEIEKVKCSYLEVCKEKNDLNEKLREELEAENETKLKIKLDSMLSDKLEAQQRYLKEQWMEEKNGLVESNRRVLEANALELKSLRDKMKIAEDQCKKVELDKQSFELKSAKIESELREKCSSVEKLAKESEEKHSQKETELEAFGAKLNDENLYLSNQLAKSESNLTELKRNYEAEKLVLLESIEKMTKEREILAIDNKQLNDKLQNEVKKFKETDLSRTKELEAKVKEASDKLVKMQLCLNETSQKLSQAQARLENEEKRLTEIQKEKDELLANTKKSYEERLG
jgi:chromosome segregation ATPase